MGAICARVDGPAAEEARRLRRWRELRAMQDVVRVDAKEECVDGAVRLRPAAEQAARECICGRKVVLPELLAEHTRHVDHVRAYLNRGGDANAISHYHYEVHRLERAFGSMTVCHWVSLIAPERPGVIQVLDMLVRNGGSFFAVRTTKGYSGWDIARATKHHQAIRYLQQLRALRMVLFTLAAPRSLKRSRSPLRLLPVELVRKLAGLVYSFSNEREGVAINRIRGHGDGKDEEGGGAIPEPAFYRPKFCKLDHPLGYDVRGVEARGLIRCDVCLQNIPRGQRAWTCYECNYDQCVGCAG